MTATLTISRTERETLHWLMCRRLFVLGQDPPTLARAEGVGTEQLAEEFGEDLRLMQGPGLRSRVRRRDRRADHAAREPHQDARAAAARRQVRPLRRTARARAGGVRR